MNSDEINELIKYIKSLLFDLKIQDGIPDNLADNEELIELDKVIRSIRETVNSIGTGDLFYNIIGKGYVIGVLKNLQASLKNLTWQTKAISSGDFSQTIDFLGEFSEAFNNMTRKLETSIQEAKEAKEYFENVFQTIPDATIITGINKGEIFGYNRAFLDLTGYSEEEVISNNLIDLNLYTNLTQRETLLYELKKYGYCKNMEVIFQNKKKGRIITLVSSKMLHIKDQIFILSVIRDVTHLKEIEQKLRESEERHRLLADNASDVIWTMNLEGKFTYISPSVEKLRGYTVEEVLKQSQEEVLCPDSLRHMQEGIERAVTSVQNNEPFDDFRGELEQPCKDGSTVWTEVTVSGIYNEEREFVGMLGVSRDITDRRKMEEEIKRLSITDKLTQLYNRLKLDNELEIEIERSSRSEHTFSVILMDIDRFKLVNDTYGHQAGDSVLMEMAEILKNHVRNVDIVGRWGGEEFLIILPETAKEGGLFLAEKLRKMIDDTIFDKVGKITASFGVAVYLRDSSPASIVSRADEALYKAKENGRNRVEFL